MYPHQSGQGCSVQHYSNHYRSSLLLGSSHTACTCLTLCSTTLNTLDPLYSQIRSKMPALRNSINQSTLHTQPGTKSQPATSPCTCPVSWTGQGTTCTAGPTRSVGGAEMSVSEIGYKLDGSLLVLQSVVSTCSVGGADICEPEIGYKTGGSVLVL